MPSGAFANWHGRNQLSVEARNSASFSNRLAVNPTPLASSFVSALAASPDGGVVAYWTDMRNDATFAGRTGHGEDAFLAKAS